MARIPDEAENHWPGFVDALSTIVMVVTFLLIILGVVIFIIAQQIQETVGNAKIDTGQKEIFIKKPEPNEIKLDDKPTPENTIAQIIADEAKAKSELAKAQAEIVKFEAIKAEAEAEAEATKAEIIKSEAIKAEAEAETAKAEAAEAETQENIEQIKLETAKAEASAKQAEAQAQKMKLKLQEQLDGSFKINLTEELRQDRKTESEKSGQRVRSEVVDVSKQITIAKDETPKEFKANIVQSANAILTLIFDGKSVVIDSVSATEISKFLINKQVIKQKGKLEIRSYVNLSTSSIGEGRRLAFYRAMAARNELLKLELDPSNISIKVKEVDDDKLDGILKIYIKP
ncbi:MAG: hypothetical protein HRU28_01480 [Rhizobiales bacterium]|nr:hypothetical protein [Hyphomicrobiales bacterium]